MDLVQNARGAVLIDADYFDRVLERLVGEAPDDLSGTTPMLWQLPPGKDKALVAGPAELGGRDVRARLRGQGTAQRAPGARNAPP